MKQKRNNRSFNVDSPDVKNEGKWAGLLKAVRKWLVQTSGQDDSSVSGMHWPQQWIIYKQYEASEMNAKWNLVCPYVVSQTSQRGSMAYLFILVSICPQKSVLSIEPKL